MDSLLFRATAADGFRAPTIADLYGGGSQTFSFFTDPCDTNFGSSRDNADHPRQLRGRHGRDRQHLPPARPGPGSGRTRPTRRRRSPSPRVPTRCCMPEQSKSQTIGARVEPELRRRPEHLPRLVEDPHRRHHRRRRADHRSSTTATSRASKAAARRPCSPATRCWATSTSCPSARRNAGFRKVEGFDFDVAYRWSDRQLGRLQHRLQHAPTRSNDYTVSHQRSAHSALDGRLRRHAIPLRSNLNVGWNKGRSAPTGRPATTRA